MFISWAVTNSELGFPPLSWRCVIATVTAYSPEYSIDSGGLSTSYSSWLPRLQTNAFETVRGASLASTFVAGISFIKSVCMRWLIGCNFRGIYCLQLNTCKLFYFVTSRSSFSRSTAHIWYFRYADKTTTFTHNNNHQQFIIFPKELCE